jgi:hypothetical protein
MGAEFFIGLQRIGLSLRRVEESGMDFHIERSVTQALAQALEPILLGRLPGCKGDARKVSTSCDRREGGLDHPAHTAGPQVVVRDDEMLKHKH